MQSNAYLILIILCCLVGLLTWMGFYKFNELRLEQIERNKTTKVKIEKLKQDIETQKADLKTLRFENEKNRVTAREQALKVLNLNQELRKLDIVEQAFNFAYALERDKEKIIDRNTGEIRDTMQEELSVVERTHQEMGARYSKFNDSLNSRKADLEEKEAQNEADYKTKLDELERKIQIHLNLLKQEHKVPVNEYQKPESLGRVIQSLHAEGKIIINLGSLAGIKQNYKFIVFGRRANGDPFEKGFAIVKDIETLYSVCAIVHQNLEGEPIISGDHIGSPAFRRGGRKFYIAGTLVSKFKKSQMIEHLKYMGNQVLDELVPEVDVMIVGKYGEAKILDAAKMGTQIIRENQMVPFLGD